MSNLKTVSVRFAQDRNGASAVMFALALVPVLGLAGAAVDYSRGAALRSHMIAAVDAAALTAGRENAQGPAKRDELARKVFDAHMAGYPNVNNIRLSITERSGVIRVTAEADQRNLVAGILGLNTSKVAVGADVGINDSEVEIALVLDNTGSMKNDMGNLKKAARKFVDIVFRFGSNNDTVRMSIVPFNASVNVGVQNLPLPMVDTRGESYWHMRRFRNQQISQFTDCTKKPTPPVAANPGNGNNGNGNSGNNGNGNGNNGNGNGNQPQPTPVVNPPAPAPKPPAGPRGSDRADAASALGLFAAIAQELFGVKAAHADVTPNTRPPFSGTMVSTPSDYLPFSAQLPDGFQFGSPCALKNPKVISHYDLFGRIPGTKWKGCVEARPEPYDVTDDPPVAGTPNTLFVPYFWPDEPGDITNNGKKYVNSYLSDTGTMPIGWRAPSGEWQNFYNLFKYNGLNPARIEEAGPTTSGPNAACPDELVRLTSNTKALYERIDTLKHWFGGGTIISEGVMWGWRTLSPKAPFSDGRTGAKVKKYMVVMSDGAQTIELNQRNGVTMSDYSAYGYLKGGRFPKEDFAVAEDYLDKRAALACENAKKTGIRVFTVLFRENSNYAKDLMRACASRPEDMYMADNPAELERAFEDIGGVIAQLRLMK